MEGIFAFQGDAVAALAAAVCPDRRLDFALKEKLALCLLEAGMVMDRAAEKWLGLP